MFKLILKFLIVFILGTIIACSSGSSDSPPQKTEEPDSITFEDIGSFYDTVYQSEGFRLLDSDPWQQTDGIMQIKFTKNSSDQGIFAVYSSNYRESLYTLQVCSGGYKGNFTMDYFFSSKEKEDYSFNIQITDINLTNGCITPNNENISLYRVLSGEVILKTSQGQVLVRAVSVP